MYGRNITEHAWEQTEQTNFLSRCRLVAVRDLDGAMERPRLVAVRDLDGAMERPRSVGVRGLDVAV
jgi:hypothetical protein